MKQIVLVIALFTFGVLTSEFTHHFIGEAEADVGGMNYYQLKRDRDFKKAVKSVVSGNCFVEGEYVYC